MKNPSSIAFAVVLLPWFTTSSASAAILTLSPSLQNAAPGQTVSLDLVIDGLGDFSPDSLGVFDIDILFDPAAISLTDFILGPFLGDIALLEALDFSGGDLGGLVNVAEASLLPAADLDALQPASFTLATLEFSVDVLAVGSSTTLVIDSGSALADAFGTSLSLDGVGDAVIFNPVPEPSTLTMFGSGAVAVAIGMALSAARRRRREQQLPA